MKRILPGQKAKVYIDKKQVAYGEVLGIGIENKLILANRPDFHTLRTSDFDLFRDRNEVEFLTTSQLPIIQWLPNQSI